MNSACEAIKVILLTLIFTLVLVHGYDAISAHNYQAHPHLQDDSIDFQIAQAKGALDEIMNEGLTWELRHHPDVLMFKRDTMLLHRALGDVEEEYMSLSEDAEERVVQRLRARVIGMVRVADALFVEMKKAEFDIVLSEKTDY